MIHIGPHLIYKILWIGLDRSASDRRPWWARKEESMSWTTPILVEICIGLEINGYMPAEF
jgi:coenzyme PQQ precursor peptide PqqA